MNKINCKLFENKKCLYIKKMDHVDDDYSMDSFIYEKESNLDEYLKANNVTKPESPITVCDVDNLNTISSHTLHCHHNIVYDYIDLTPEKSMQIKYCDKCMETFPFP
jgi:hypothetical protein